MENLNKTIPLFDKEGNQIQGTVISTYPFSIRLENGKILNGGFSVDYTYNYNFVIYGETPEDAYYFNDAGDAENVARYPLPENYVRLVYWYIKIYENGELVGEKYYFDKDACFQDYTTFRLHFWHMESFSTNEITYTQESGRNNWAYNHLGFFEARLDRCINNKHHYTLISTNLN